MLQFSSSEKKVGKTPEKMFFGPNLHRKGAKVGPRWKNLFLADYFWKFSKSSLSAFRKFLFYQNIMFWLSYESFSILNDVFSQLKCHFQQKQLCLRTFFRRIIRRLIEPGFCARQYESNLSEIQKLQNKWTIIFLDWHF